MTICIAASCLREEEALTVVISDTMLSAPFLTAEFEHQDTKIEEVGANCVALSAGDALCVGEVLGEAQSLVAQVKQPNIWSIAEAVKSGFSAVRKRRAADRFLEPSRLCPIGKRCRQQN